MLNDSPANEQNNSNGAHGKTEPKASIAMDYDAGRIHNIIVNGRRTRIRLENEIWNALQEICRFEQLEIDKVCTNIFNHTQRRLSLSSAIRVFVVDYYRSTLKCYTKER
ncbi:hypothetical protein CCP2SC5_730009 [Azospirillaceae bacterium]